MSQANKEASGLPVPQHLREWLTAEVRRDLDHHVAARVGVARLTLARAAAGFPVNRGTIALIERAYLRTRSTAA